MKMKLIAAFTAFLLVIGTIIYDSTVTPKEIMIVPEIENKSSFTATDVPQFTFKTLEGKNYALKDLQEEKVLIHFWAGWCTVCFAEFPDLLEYIKTSEGKVALLAIAIDDQKDPMDSFLKRLESKEGVELDVPGVYWIWDETKDISLHTFNTVRVPETIIIDKNRQMIDKIVGPAEWEQYL